jgi:hypothetical protein
MKRRGLLLIVLGGALAVWPALGYVREFVAVDSCLDAGGSFDYAQSRCDRAENHPFVAYSERHPNSLSIAAVGGVVLATGIVMFLLAPQRRNT